MSNTSFFPIEKYKIIKINFNIKLWTQQEMTEIHKNLRVTLMTVALI